jgi:hypothetical protein
MNVIKLICLTIVNLGRQGLLLPQAAAAAFQHRRQMTAKNRFEVERLDRIRNPSKYLGRP